jgi:hypothetical protein
MQPAKKPWVELKVPLFGDRLAASIGHPEQRAKLELGVRHGGGPSAAGPLTMTDGTRAQIGNLFTLLEPLSLLVHRHRRQRSPPDPRSTGHPGTTSRR